MSVRPRDAAAEASRFSLRSLLPTAGWGGDPGTHIGGASVAPPSLRRVDGPTHAASEPTAHSQMAFPLNASPPAAAPVAAAPVNGSGLRFTLPAMRTHEQPPRPVGLVDTGAGSRPLKAGYLTGGFSNAASPEILRLTAVVDDMNIKLKRAADKLVSAEHSVARGNAALTSERATSHARIVALGAELRVTRGREAGVRAEMAAIPRLSDLDAEHFHPGEGGGRAAGQLRRRGRQGRRARGA